MSTAIRIVKTIQTTQGPVAYSFQKKERIRVFRQELARTDLIYVGLLQNEVGKKG